MTEFEILANQSNSYMNNAVYQVAVIIGVFISFRAARIANQSGAHPVMKALISVFGFAVVWLNLQLAAWRIVFDQAAAIRLSELQESGTKLTGPSVQQIEFLGLTSADVTSYNLFADVPSVIFSLVIFAIILIGAWGPKLSLTSN